MYYVLNVIKAHFIKGDELSTECGQLVGMLWRLWVMNLRRSNFVARGNKCDRRGGNQAG